MKRVWIGLLAVSAFSSGNLTAQSMAGGTVGNQAAFGRAIAVVGGDLLITEPNNDGRPGELHVYRKTAGKWSSAAVIRAADGEPSDIFGSVLSASGSSLLVSAARANKGMGAVYVFERDGRNNWSQAARLVAADGAPGETYGAAHALAGDLAAVGAPVQNAQTGAVYVYRRGANGWTAEAKLLSPDAKPQQFFGQSIAIAGNHILVGEPGNNERTGAVHVFARAQDGWQAIAKIVVTNGQKNDRFGLPLHVDGNKVYVGAQGVAGMTGAVFAFARDAQGTYRQVTRFSAPDVQTNEQFGGAIAAHGNELWIGAPRTQGARGAVYRFQQTNDTVNTQAQKLTAAMPSPSDFFGGALATNGSITAVASINDDFGLGSVAIFEKKAGAWSSTELLHRTEQRMASQTGSKTECTAGKAGAFSCNNVELQSFMSVADIGGGRGVQLSGIWGWTDPQTNREYAIVGRMDGTSFVDVTDATNPRYLGNLPLTPGATPSPWREMKTYKNYVLISADGAGAHGLQFFDLTQLRNIKGAPVTFEPTVLYKRVNSVHNIVVNEESGFAYAVGSSSGGETCGGGLHMIDIRNPLQPQFAGCFADPQTGRASTGYSHDALCVLYRGPDQDYQNKEICLGSNETMLSIADVTDKKNPKAVSRAAYPKVGYLHQGWFTKDMRYFFMNDELDEVSGLVQNTRTLIWDLADLDDPQMVGEFSSPTQASDHNLYIRDNLMYQSHYKAGVRLVDVSNPLKPVEVGFFDTAPTLSDTAGFGGSWGNFPFFKSGTWVASSMNEGLFVLKAKAPAKPVL